MPWKRSISWAFASVIGSGEEETRLRAMAKANITFLGGVDDKTLALEYSKAAAVIFTPFLEYGLIPLEANASGTPVICYGKGGITETMVPTDGQRASGAAPTAVFFYEQTADALIKAVNEFQKNTFSSNELVRHASQWGVLNFKRRFEMLC
jgi:glycosyltransferase involved in cell wall biosynthesis